MSDFIPRTDAELLVWANNYNNQIKTSATSFGLNSTNASETDTAFIRFQTAFDEYVTAQAIAKSKFEAKDDARDNLVNLIREQARIVQATSSVTNQQKATLGLTVKDGTRTASSKPTTRPTATVDTSKRLQHTIAFRDEATPTSRAKPKGVLGCEIWVKIGGNAPLDASECQFLSLDTATPYIAEYAGTNAGQTAHYLMRWVSNGGEKGSWSETISATIVG
jgi:hypothetical protein